MRLISSNIIILDLSVFPLCLYISVQEEFGSMFFGSVFLYMNVSREDCSVNQAVFFFCPLVESNNNHRAANAPCSSG